MGNIVLINWDMMLYEVYRVVKLDLEDINVVL